MKAAPGKILKNRATISSAEKELSRFFFPFMKEVQIVMVGRRRDYLIIKTNGITEKGTVKDGEFKVISNFHLENLEKNNYTCYRYDLATKKLNDNFTNTESEFEELLFITHQEYPAATVYSNIYNLSEGSVNIYYNNNFKNFKKIDFDSKNAFGITYLENGLFKKRMVDDLIGEYNKGGYERGISFFKKHKSDESKKYTIDAQQLVDFSEFLFIKGKATDYIKILKKNVLIFPESDAAHAALGKFYLRSGRIDLATKNYKAALIINKDNWWAYEMIEGDFNEWTPIRNICTLNDNGVWESCVRAKPGTYKYRFIVDGKHVATRMTGNKRNEPQLLKVTID